MKLFLKINTKKVKLLVAFCVMMLSVQAQETYTLKGKIIDNNTPVFGANVLLEGTNKGMTTASDGAFVFSLPKGTYTLVVHTLSVSKKVTVLLNTNQDITVDISDGFVNLNEIMVSAVKVKASSPVTHSNVSKKELSKRNLGQDIPTLLNYLPSVVTTSDAGAGIGYSGIRVRGSDATRVNVTINGIPYNDAESQGTFWVNLPDFTSSVENIQLQRGVGTSTNGSGAFGASIHLTTDAVSENAFTEINNSVGSFNTRKHTVRFSTGLLNDHIEVAGRFSKIDSDGYIDRAWSDLKSYFLQATYKDDNTLLKALTFSGHEKTYQSWYGVTKEEMELYGRTYNPYTYDNEIDNYQQDHYQLHWSEQWNKNWSSNIGLNYTYGRGYYEQFRESDAFEDYNLTPISIGGTTIDETDLIRRRWLDNDFYVVNMNSTYQNNATELILGASLSSYEGDHFGEIIWAQYASDSQIRDRYYESVTKKTDFNFFTKLTISLSERLALYSDLQLRNVGIETQGLTSYRAPINVDERYTFFNPKAGATYEVNPYNSFYFSYARATKEPNRNDFENGVTTYEKLNDYELGWRLNNGKMSVNTNLYYMAYNDQLVLTGAIDDTGAPIRATSGESYRLGLEIDANVFLNDVFRIQPNIAISSNKNLDFVTSQNGELVKLGKTTISFSPELIMGNAVVYQPNENFQVSLLSKYVGEQYMSNIDSKNSILESYFINDLNLVYQLNPKKIVSRITFTALLNNIFNVNYISNGYYYTYDDTWSNPGEVITLDGAGYYPQATRNFLVGISIEF